MKYELNVGSTMQWSINDTGNKIINASLHTLQYQSRSLPKLDEFFLPKRFGWMGGDVATSIALPNLDNPESNPRVYVWLFGDSLIGTSSGYRYFPHRFYSHYRHSYI